MNQSKKTLVEFYETVGANYPEEQMVYRTLYGQLRKAFILSYLQRIQGSLLDIGCNSGHYLAAYQNGERWGMDLSRAVLRRTPDILHRRLVVADAERLYAFRSASFDHALCSEVLEHCLNPSAVFNGIAHVLRPGGRALITTPNYKSVKPGWVQVGCLSDYGAQGDSDGRYFHTAYRPQELRALAKAAGLLPVECGTLEKEVKYAAKLPAALLLCGRLLNRLLHSQAFEAWLLRQFNRLSLQIYVFCRITGLQPLLLRFIDEGVRSYIWVEKPVED
ncbi:MAG TPA: class I SAM-dependent methyltransferase [bacterium]|nr:class I SAM-dependent methyltransferase [bacterium]